MTRRNVSTVVALAMVTAGFSGCSDLEPPPPRPVRGTIGEETFGVLCDRIGAQSLPEDLTGGSYRAICHKDATTGRFAHEVDETPLPHMTADERAKGGAATRALGRARIETLGKHRAHMIAALDAMIPENATVAARDPEAGTGACGEGVTRRLSEELARVLSRMSEAYNDGSMPDATRSLGRLMDALKTSPEAQQALARIASRTGYRPQNLALGVLRPALAYPRLRELANATLKVIAADTDPYSRSARGEHVATPGPAHGTLETLASAAAHELRSLESNGQTRVVKSTPDTRFGFDTLSRPRTLAEILAHVLASEDPAFGAGAPRYVVRRDFRGMATVGRVAGGLPSPFVDQDFDGIPDTDVLGRFVAAPRQAVPSPFLAAPAADDATPRDGFGRAHDGADGPLVYDYVDTTRSFAAALLRNTAPLVNPNVDAHHETLMDALAGAFVALGPREGAGFRADASPLLDLAHAALEVAADPNVDATLALTRRLAEEHEPEIAHVPAAALGVKASADALGDVSLPATSTLWDELIDLVAQIAAVTDADGAPALLEKLLRGLASEEAKSFAPTLQRFVHHRDEIDWNRADVNGPPMNVSTGVLGGPLAVTVDRDKPARGFDRSVFQRFLQLIHDTNGVSVCNRQGAVIKARMDVPVLGPTDVSIPDSLLVRAFWGKSSFGECEVFKIDNMASFYLQSIVKQGRYVLRDKQLRDGITINFGVAKVDAGATATTVHLLEQSGEITGYQPPGTTDPAKRTGFWSKPDSRDLLTRPEWLNRNLFFPNGTGTAPKPARAKAFSDALNPDHAGTSVCPKRVVADPLPPSDPNYTPGGKIYLPACADGDWLDQRDSHTIFALERDGFYEALAPIVGPFVELHREDLLIQLFDVLHRHWADARGADSECRLSGAPNAKACSKDGAVRFEPALDKALGDLVPALRDLLVVLAPADATKTPSFYVPCATRDAAGACKGATVSGLRTLAVAVRAAVVPAESAKRDLADRRGVRTTTWNDGTPVPQVTPVYLVLNALKSVDRAFEAYRDLHPADAARKDQWLRARSQLVDQFLATTTTAGTTHFRDLAIARVTPIVIDVLRQQLEARCPEWPNRPCAWASHDLLASATETLQGPLFGNAVDLLDALRKDPAARVELERFLTYLLDERSSSDALVSLLATSTDFVQVLQDERNLSPVFRLVSTALESSDGPSALDAWLGMLGRLTAVAKQWDGTDACTRELDPNQVLTRVLQSSVGSITLPGGEVSTPAEAIVDTIVDVNRVAPGSRASLDAQDYASIADSVSSFVQNRESGLEQFYAIVRNGTRK